MNKLAPLALVAGLAGVANANGFLVNEFDAKATGRGDATAATAVDPSSIYYNIGGLAAGEGTQVIVGGSLIAPNASFTDTSGSKTESTTNPQFIPGVFGSIRINDLLAAGIGFYTPFGLAVTWPDSSPQADVATKVALHTFFITPSVGVNLGSFVPGLTVGGGIDIVPATIELRQVVFLGTDQGRSHLAGNAVGVGGRIGVMYRPQSLPRLSLGVMWRSNVKEDFSGNVNFDSPPAYRQSLPPDGTAKTSITMPQSVTGGIAYRPIDALELEADLVWTQWSKFKNLDLTVPSTSGTGTMTIVSPQDYHNRTSVRAGAEYTLTSLGTAVRAGFIYDPTPVPATRLTAILPDVDRYDVTVGATKSLGNYAVDVGLLWVLPQKRSTSSAMYKPEVKGTYDVSAFVASVSLAAKFK